MPGVLSKIWHHPLSRRNRIAAYARFIAWQLRSRLRPGKHRVPFVGDTHLLVSRGMTGATGNIYNLLDEPHDMGLLLHVLGEGELFVDIGANVGTYSILAAGVCRARVIAFEPVPATFTDLHDNVTSNTLDIDLRNIALGDRTGTIAFTTTHGPANHVARENEPSIDIGLTTLDAALAGEVPLMMKIDVEGFEPAVLAGGERTFADARLRVIIMEINEHANRYGDAAALLAKVAAWGFISCTYDAQSRTLTPAPPSTIGNTIFVRDVNEIRDRIATAPRIKLRHGHL